MTGNTNTDSTTPEATADEASTITDPERVIEAVYNINSHAKKYAELGTKNYREGKKATAKQNSVRKNVLYAVKKHVIHAFVTAGECERVELHVIDGSEFVCHYFEFEESWSFHTPVDQWHGAIPDCEPEELPGFGSDAEKTRSDMSLKESLLLIEDVTGENANGHLEQEYISYGRNAYFAG